MTIQPRLVVIGLGPDGRETCLRDGPTPPITARALPGQEMYLQWGTADGGATVGVTAPEPTVLPFFAGVGGTRLMFVRFPPARAAQPPVGDADAIAAEVAERLPGLMDVFEAGDDSGMHTTDTVDYGICVEGELWLELPDGQEIRLTPGTSVVQLGTRHAWHNRGDVPALMCFVGIGAGRAA